MEERKVAAKTLEAMEPGAFDYILMDSLPAVGEEGLDKAGTYNPTWCSYGTAPNPGWVISMDGTVPLAAAPSKRKPHSDQLVYSGCHRSRSPSSSLGTACQMRPLRRAWRH